ncbi:MAG TPA: hypothetical protein VG318_05025 [Actinomycetota bacterium]|nr:hypothetical protein [Actinomycetota bacterium]
MEKAAEEGWGAEAREEFIAGCESSGNTKESCSCLQEKLEERYPDAEDPDEFDQEEVVGFAEECAG